jgi:hypothetical protein
MFDALDPQMAPRRQYGSALLLKLQLSSARRAIGVGGVLDPFKKSGMSPP